MSHPHLDLVALRRALAIRDLTDPAAGPHAMQALLHAIVDRLATAWRTRPVWVRRSPVVSIADNYDRLLYSAEATVRDARHTRYVCDTAVLRTQTTSMVPGALRELALATGDDVLLVCPGVVYRRDAIDRTHCGEPHQVDLWRIRRGAPLEVADLHEMIAHVLAAALPGRRWSLTPAHHSYTERGQQIDVENGDHALEVGECGLASPVVLAAAGLSEASGLAMGLGLDRLLMLRKSIDDIRLLRCEDPRVRSQMNDLLPYQPVSRMPPAPRDLSIVVDDDASAEEVGDRIRAHLGDDAAVVESVTVLSSTPAVDLPAVAAERLGIAPGQYNLLVRVVLRALDRTLTRPECDVLRDRIYEALHRGTRAYWCARQDPGA